MTKSGPKILYVTAGGDAPFALANGLHSAYPNLIIALEEPQSKIDLIKRRAKSKGATQAFGQLATMILSRLGKKLFFRTYKSRISDLKLKTELAENIHVEHVQSPNSQKFIKLINLLNPDVIFLSGCRILSEKTLVQVKKPILNYHAGINPKYRGMFGGYWARRLNDLDNYGSTVHFVDKGVDTGGILYQKFISPPRNETILTDALTQVASSIEISIKAIQDVQTGNAKVVKSSLPSRLHFQPTIWSYLWGGITKNIW